MASKRSAEGLGGKDVSEKALPLPPVVKIRLRVENLLGQRTELLAPAHSTIRAVKEALSSLYGVNPDRQSLVRCGGGGDQRGQYTRLEERKTLQEYGVVNDERLLMIPVVRTGPTSEESRTVKIFVEDNAKVAGAIDRLLKDCGKTRKPDCHYVLAQMDSQRPGDYTILEIPMAKSTTSESSEQSDPGKQVSQRVLTAAERKQNQETYTKMKKLRESIDRSRKHKKLPPTTPVAKMEMPCGSCGALTSDAECSRCEQVYCPKHFKSHACRPWCRQQ